MNIHHKLSFLVLFLFVHFMPVQGSGLSQETGMLFKGKIGSYPIYLFMHDGFDGRIVSYLYAKSKPAIIQLLKDSEGEKYVFSLYRSYYADSNGVNREIIEIVEQFKLEKAAEGSLSGTWTDGKKTLVVHLDPIDLKTISHAYADLEFVKELEPIEYIATSFLDFQREKISKIDGRTLVWIQERHTTNRLFRLGNGFPSQIREVVNPMLDKEQMEDILSHELRPCFYSFVGHLEKDQEIVPGGGVVDVDITFLSKNFIGFRFFSSYGCVRSYCNEEFQFYSLTTGAQLGFDEIFDPRINDWLQQRTDSLWDQDVAEGIRVDGFCDDVSYKQWTVDDWGLFNREETYNSGMYISSSDFTGCADGCGFDFRISVEELKPYLRPAWRGLFDD